MADYFFGEITFPKCALKNDEVKNVIEKEFVKENIEKIDGVLIQCRSECARYGEFETLEKLFVNNQIPFDRYNNAYYEHDSATRKYRPEAKGLPSYDVVIWTNANGDSFVTTEKISDILATNNARDAVEKIKILLEETDPDIPEIEDYLVG